MKKIREKETKIYSMSFLVCFLIIIDERLIEKFITVGVTHLS